jgi:hypothetical protein
MPTPCTHPGQVRDVEPRTPEGCEERLRSGDCAGYCSSTLVWAIRRGTVTASVLPGRTGPT